MKLLKRFGAVLLTLTMLMSFGAVTASADPTLATDLTLTNAQGTSLSGSSFSAYKIVDSTNGKITVNYTAQVTPALNTALGKPANTAYADDAAILTALNGLTNNSSQAAAFASALKDGIAAMTSAPTPVTGNNGVFKGLPYGYYLIVQNTGSGDGTVLSDPILDNFDGTQATSTVHVKISKATITKKIVIGDKSTGTTTDDGEATTAANLFDTSTAAVGENVHYRSLSTIPVYPSSATGLNYTVTDSLSSGLTLNAANIIVYKVNGTTHTLIHEGTDYTLTVTPYSGTPTAPVAETDKFTVKLTGDDNIRTLGNEGDSILITYSAVLGNNLSATNFGSTGNPNSVELTYSTETGTAYTNNYTTPWDTVITYTNRLVITKTDSASDKLPGAKFELYYGTSKKDAEDAANLGTSPVDTQTTADVTGTLTFNKLKAGYYTLKEKTAPAGYSTMPNEDFQVIAKNTNDGGNTYDIYNGSIVVGQSGNPAALAFKATWSCPGLSTFASNVSVNNNDISASNNSISASITDSSLTLPFSGGMGTALFTGGGILLIAAAGTLLVVYNKKRKVAKH